MRDSSTHHPLLVGQLCSLMDGLGRASGEQHLGNTRVKCGQHPCWLPGRPHLHCLACLHSPWCLGSCQSMAAKKLGAEGKAFICVVPFPSGLRSLPTEAQSAASDCVRPGAVLWEEQWHTLLQESAAAASRGLGALQAELASLPEEQQLQALADGWVTAGLLYFLGDGADAPLSSPVCGCFFVGDGALLYQWARAWPPLNSASCGWMPADSVAVSQSASYFARVLHMALPSEANLSFPGSGLSGAGMLRPWPPPSCSCSLGSAPSQTSPQRARTSSACWPRWAPCCVRCASAWRARPPQWPSCHTACSP